MRKDVEFKTEDGVTRPGSRPSSSTIATSAPATASQVADYRDAITYASTLPEVDDGRIGIWGSSHSGGHVLVVGAVDRRVKCVVSQVR